MQISWQNCIVRGSESVYHSWNSGIYKCVFLTVACQLSRIEQFLNQSRTFDHSYRAQECVRCTKMMWLLDKQVSDLRWQNDSFDHFRRAVTTYIFLIKMLFLCDMFICACPDPTEFIRHTASLKSVTVDKTCCFYSESAGVSCDFVRKRIQNDFWAVCVLVGFDCSRNRIDLNDLEQLYQSSFSCLNKNISFSNFMFMLPPLEFVTLIRWKCYFTRNMRVQPHS